jgi:hypothetical protein
MDRFLAYTKGREPVITVNVVAAILLGIIVRAAEQYFGFQWDEFSLTTAGAIAVAAATWLARKGVWAPSTVKRETGRAYQQGLEDAGAKWFAPKALRRDDEDGDGR